MSSISRAVAGLVAMAAVLGAPAANAQQWMVNGIAGASSGFEGGGGRARSMGRAQTRLRIGADLAVDESPEDVFGAAVLVAVEPRTAFGFDGRYTRVIRDRFAVSGGVVAYLQPGSLVGPVAAFEYRHPLSSWVHLTAGPELDVFVFGTDLPDRTVLWQALVNVGVRVAF